MPSVGGECGSLLRGLRPHTPGNRSQRGRGLRGSLRVRGWFGGGRGGFPPARQRRRLPHRPPGHPGQAAQARSPTASLDTPTTGAAGQSPLPDRREPPALAPALRGQREPGPGSGAVRRRTRRKAVARFFAARRGRRPFPAASTQDLPELLDARLAGTAGAFPRLDFEPGRRRRVRHRPPLYVSEVTYSPQPRGSKPMRPTRQPRSDADADASTPDAPTHQPRRGRHVEQLLDASRDRSGRITATSTTRQRTKTSTHTLTIGPSTPTLTI